ncbi:MAG: insulinase family protein [Bacteroidetes bacterium]|nr:insulinase family protein [Bacteroidota bacterium]
MRCYKSFIIVFVSSYLVFSLNIMAQEAFDNAQVLVPDPKITIGKLDNGLKYYIRENKRPEKRAELRLVVKAGSILENDNQQGLAHFVEHMAFNGTKSFPKQELVNFLEKSGIRFGPELNAYTSFDETVYMLQVPTDSPEVMKTGFQILKEWAQDISFHDEEIDKERNVIIEEWRLYRDADYRVSMKHIPYKLYKSRYAERLPIGKKEIVESCPYDALKKFYRDWYRPDLTAVFAVGDFDKKEIEALIKQLFSGLKNPQNKRERIKYPVPDHKEVLVSIVADPELTRASAEIIFKRDTKEPKTAGEYRDMIIGGLYDAMLNARLRELLQQPEPPFIYGYSGDGRFIGEKHAYFLGASVMENSILGGLETVIREGYRVKQHGFTVTELERQKEQILRAMERAYLERDKTESGTIINEYIRNFLTDETIPGIEVELSLFRQFLPGISLEEVNKLADERMTQENRVIAISAPKKESLKLPAREEVIASFNKTAGEKIEPYIDKVSSRPLTNNLPSPGIIIEEKKNALLGVTEWILSNGARVILKPTDFKNEEILFSAFSDGGTSLVPDSEYVSAVFASSIIGQSGIGDFNATDLQKELSGKIVNISPSISQLSEGLSGSTTPKDLEIMFQLLHLYAVSPRKDTTAYTSLITRYEAMLQNRDVSPEAAYNDTIQVTLANYHFRSRPVSIPMIEEINLDKAISVYKDRFADFSDFTFLFVGSFNIDTIRPLVERYIANLPSIKRIESWKDIGIENPKGIIKKQLHRGIEPKSTVNITFTGPFDWSQENRYYFNSMIEALNIKLREVLREEKGGTYGVRAYGSHSLIPRQRYSISVSWGCNPDRVDELVNGVTALIDSLKFNTLDMMTVEKIREIQRRRYEKNIKQNGFWLNNLHFYYDNNENPEMILNYPKLVDRLSAQAIQDAVKKYFNNENYVKVVLYPEKKESKP